MCDLAGEEVEEAFQLVGVAPERRRQLDRVGILSVLDGTYVELQLVAVALDAAEDAHGVTLGKTAVEEVDVVPDTSLDAAARIHELQREVVGARSRPQATLARDRIGALDDPVFRKLRDRRHSSRV